MSKKLLSRLNAKILGLDSGRGGNGALTPLDIAAALGMAKNPISSPLLRVKYAGDETSRMAVLRETLKHVEAMSKEMSWAPRKGESFEKLLPALTVAACDEFISPKLCGQCHGRGERTKRGEGLIVACGHCEGTGKRDKSISDRARQMGVQRHAFADSWADRYEKVLEVLAIAEGSGSGELSKQLSEQ